MEIKMTFTQRYGGIKFQMERVVPFDYHSAKDKRDYLFALVVQAEKEMAAAISAEVERQKELSLDGTSST